MLTSSTYKRSAFLPRQKNPGWPGQIDRNAARFDPFLSRTTFLWHNRCGSRSWILRQVAAIFAFGLELSARSISLGNRWWQWSRFIVFMTPHKKPTPVSSGLLSAWAHVSFYWTYTYSYLYIILDFLCSLRLCDFLLTTICSTHDHWTR